MNKQYDERDAAALDEAGGYYIRHVSAMTKEGLHSKSDIAAELGFRDMRIDQLNHRINQLLTERNATGLAIERAISGRLPLTEHPLAERFRMIAGLSAARNTLGVQVDNLEQQRDELLAALQGMIDIANDSQGVAGYHLNGEVADWGEFEEWQAACDAIAKAKGGSVNHFPDVAKMVPGGWQMVPVEPTFDMKKSASKFQIGDDDLNLIDMSFEEIVCIYKAMLAAAPKLGGE